MYYILKVEFDTGEVNRNGKPVTNISQYFVEGTSTLDVETRIAEYLKDSQFSYEVTEVKRSKIEAALVQEQIMI